MSLFSFIYFNRQRNKYKMNSKLCNTISPILCVLLLINLTCVTPQRNRNRQQQQQQQQPVQQPQVDPQQEIDIQQAINQVFNTTPTQTPPPRGFGVIVTPEPNVSPTTAPQTLVTDGVQCTCVPYHMCDPNTNSVKNPGDDNVIDGFGLIDIRFDPEDCQDVLDVCCKGASVKEEPIVPPPVTNKPNRASGCGIRNVGGIDFKITGAFVSNCLSINYDQYKMIYIFSFYG